MNSGFRDDDGYAMDVMGSMRCTNAQCWEIRIVANGVELYSMVPRSAGRLFPRCCIAAASHLTGKYNIETVKDEQQRHKEYAIKRTNALVD